MERFWLAFIPLFVAFDVVGLLPLYWALAQGQPGARRRQAVDSAVVIAFLVALAFLWLSGWIFDLMGMQMADVMIAGGIIVFGIALNDLLHPDKHPWGSADVLGVVPLGVPLIVGPAVLATVVLTRQHYGLRPTLWALSLNILLTWTVLQVADRLMERVGQVAARVISKVSSLVLAAFAVMLVRQGVVAVLGR